MTTQNFFALLGDDENDDPSALIARAGAGPPAPVKDLKKQQQAPRPLAKLPTKPAPPAQAVKEAQADGGRVRGGGRGSYENRVRNFEGGYNNRTTREAGLQGGEQNDRSFSNYRNGSSRGGYNVGNVPLNAESPIMGEEGGRQNNGGGRGRGRGGRGRGRGYGYMGDGEERSRQREYDRRSGTGRGNEVKRDGAGRGNWGMEMDQRGAQDIAEAGVVVEEEKPVSLDVTEKKPEEVQPESEDLEKKNEAEEEEKEMTLEEYEKLLGEKRKPLEALKAKQRSVTVDKDFDSMQLVEKKSDEEVFLKLGADKGKKKEVAEKDEKAKKPLSINEFLKPSNGDGYFSPSGRRGRGGRGRGEHGGARGSFGSGYSNSREAVIAPSIEDPSQFPTLGGK